MSFLEAYSGSVLIPFTPSPSDLAIKTIQTLKKHLLIPIEYTSPRVNPND